MLFLDLLSIKVVSVPSSVFTPLVPLDMCMGKRGDPSVILTEAMLRQRFSVPPLVRLEAPPRKMPALILHLFSDCRENSRAALWLQTIQKDQDRAEGF